MEEPFLGLTKYASLKGISVLHCVLFTLFLTGCSATECFKDPNIGDKEGNVYYCDNEATPECCQEENEFTCCEITSEKTLREQLILWGSLAAVVLAIALVMCYFFKDGACCKDDTPLKEKCCRCCRKKEDEKDLTVIPPMDAGPSFASSSRENTLENFNTTFYRDTPMPTFKFKAPKY